MGRNLTNTEVVNEVLQARGYDALNPTQKKALDAGLLSDNRNFVAASPTASGKTVIGELAIIDAVKKGKKGVYLVPLRSLANEKFDDFKKYVGYRINVKTGDYDSDEHELEDCDIIISTYEKWDSILRHKPDWLNAVGCVVADEGHMLTDESRGSTIEVLLTRMASLKVKVVILSAVLRNVSDVANWLGGRFMESSWRPTPLRKGVYLFDKGKDQKNDRHQNREIESLLEYEDGQKENVPDETGDAIGNLVVQTLRAGGQCLVFARGRKEAVRLAGVLSREVEKELAPRDLLALSNYQYGDALKSTDAEISRKLTHSVIRGVGFHHAGMSSKQKKVVEGLFRELKLKVVCCTPTLAQGLNLPARRVIIQTTTRYDEKLGPVTIPRWEFENMAGRAGRPK
jgi:helicase